MAQAAIIAKRSPRTVREWAARHDIGRRIAGGDWMVSRVALLMLLEGDAAALALYLSGERQSADVDRYFSRLRCNNFAEISAKTAIPVDLEKLT
ncbi:hypothetical protein [Methylobacterium dankookense]|uniref:hypothetical protein n=1 Tax=Methylobacterium dankookense TaxID=560405 RepID=UPI0016439EF4|nr:hypothetical protein [Methylobacterium dankookense]